METDMILFYIDESGTGLKDKQSPYFVLSATAIPADAEQEMAARVIALKRELVRWAKPEDFEIKGRDLRRGEKLFSSLDWEERVDAIMKVASLLANSPCRIFTVQVDTRDLPEYISSDADLYRIAFWRLLDVIEHELSQSNRPGMLLMDARSDLHSSVQDRRTVEAYQDWSRGHSNQVHIVGVPWFGFSAFYSGLQLADFAAYLVDFVANETAHAQQSNLKRRSPLMEAFGLFAHKVEVYKIP
ncbi:MAG: DUF3800 domain-containing protein [Caldilineaceae bacterium]|nr:DUF3800 domain-containing protein [Caldilineaceae bacterium]MBP8108449.1 DUF3800 domain-containing protein [Caldilineaceae bacterium]